MRNKSDCSQNKLVFEKEKQKFLVGLCTFSVIAISHELPVNVTTVYRVDILKRQSQIELHQGTFLLILSGLDNINPVRLVSIFRMYKESKWIERK